MNHFNIAEAERFAEERRRKDEEAAATATATADLHQTRGMMMARNPIAMMIDKACGVTDNDLQRPAPIRSVDSDTKAMMDVGDAAVAWLKLRENSTRAKFIKAEQALVDAAKALAATGWDADA